MRNLEQSTHGGCQTGLPSVETHSDSQKGDLHLAAFEDTKLSKDAEEQLVQIMKDNNRKSHKGKDLPGVSKDDLLAQLQ